MNYGQDQYFDLIDEVEDQGGELQEDLCSNTRYDFTGPKSKPVTIAGCGNQSIFVVPYEGIVRKDGEVEPGVYPLAVCAVDDDLGAWPRFGGDERAKALDSGAEKVQLWENDPRKVGR